MLGGPQAVEPMGSDRRRIPEGTTRPAHALGLVSVPVGVTLIRVENV